MKVHVIKSERHQRRKRVAAYCRVSTMESSQEESYETQKEYYESYIRCHDEWDFAGIYADQGITGTSAEKRPQFMACIKDSIDTIRGAGVTAEEADRLFEYTQWGDMMTQFAAKGPSTLVIPSDFQGSRDQMSQFLAAREAPRPAGDA